MKRVWYVAAKELLETRRDRLAALFTIILPVVFTIFLGILIGGAEKGGLPLAVANLDGQPTAQRVLDRLGQSSLVGLRTTPAADIDAAVRNQKVAAGLIIPQGFSAAIQAGKTASLTFVRVETSSGAQSLLQAVQAAVSQTNIGMLAAKTASEQVSQKTGKPLDAGLMSSAASLADAQLATPIATVQLVDASGAPANIAGGFDQSSSGSLVQWVLFGLLSVATTIVWERRKGLLRRLSVAGVRAREIVGGKMLAMLIITFLQQLLLILLGALAFHVHYFNSVPALLIVMVSLSLLAASFGLLISSVFRSEQAVIATTVISAQLLAAMGGAWFPLEITSASFTRVAHVLPSAWVMDSLHGIILKDWGVTRILYPMGIVWIWIVALFALAVWRYRPD